jgi:monothiol glutaredoxin
LTLFLDGSAGHGAVRLLDVGPTCFLPRMSEARARIESLVQSEPVVVFMKGDRRAPKCGFSASTVQILDDYLAEYATVDVLADEAIREGVKAYTSWPTIPQVFVRGEFIGGADILREMNENGELATVLGVKALSVEVPEITVTQAALEALRKFADGEPIPQVRLEISGAFEYGLDFDAPRPNDVLVKGEGYVLMLDRASARRADGMTIDFIERPDGGGFKLDNPNEPPRVKAITATDLATRIRENAPTVLFDVRTDEERAIASIPGAIALDERGKAILEHADRDAFVTFVCHHGVRSKAAADHALRMGFRNVHNLVGGIDAWSLEVDANVPRY